jgi:hypothetical protein
MSTCLVIGLQVLSRGELNYNFVVKVKRRVTESETLNRCWCYMIMITYSCTSLIEVLK